KLYKQGLTGLTERLTAETEWRQAELELADAREAAGVAVVRLFKALGAPTSPANERPVIRSKQPLPTPAKV
ncbi:MAG: hypothetical protein ACRDBH_08795, partial [Bosea sp. (in: a-proteobacteria)]